MAAPFRLARVGRLREQIRRLRAHEAEQLTARLLAARAEAVRLAEERERVGAAEAREAAAGRLTPASLQLGRDYDGALAAAERACVEGIARLESSLAAKRAEVLRARQEEEKYVRLAEAHRQRTLEEEARVVERSLDEIAIDRHRRNQKERNDDQR